MSTYTYKAHTDTTLLLWDEDWATEFQRLYALALEEARQGRPAPFPTRFPLHIPVKANQEVTVTYGERTPLITVTSDKRDRIINSVRIVATVGTKVYNKIVIAYDDAEPAIDAGSSLRPLKKRK